MEINDTTRTSESQISAHNAYAVLQSQSVTDPGTKVARVGILGKGRDRRSKVKGVEVRQPPDRIV
jgi:hypothetical protein